MSKEISAKNSIVANYWRKYYVTLHCTLCGNTGIVDTRGAKTPTGLEVGRINFCICPNGQLMRKSDEKAKKET